MIESAEEFVELRQSSDYEQYRRAAHEAASDETWKDIIYKYPNMKEWVAHNKTVPVSILRILARDPDPRVRFAVATKRKCDEDIFSILSQDTDESVRLGVACNRKTPKHILLSMKNDTWERVVEVVLERLAETDKGT